jgi:lipopolysaccharide export system permease protein
VTILDRLVLGNFLRALAVSLAGTIILFTLVDLFQNIGSFIDHEASFSMIGRYYLYKMAWIVDIVLPVGVLMSTLFTVGTMARYHELTALFAAGRSLLQVTRPILLLALLTAAISLGWREYVLPQANLAATRVWEVEINGRPDLVRPTSNVALTGPEGRIYYARSYDPQKGVLRGLRVITTEDSQVLERLDAARAIWSGRHWILQDGTLRRFDGEEETVIPFTSRPAPELAATPASFDRERIRPEDMNISQLLRYSQLVRRSGGDPTHSLVDIQFQLAFPAVHLIVAFLGILLASRPRKTTIASGFGLTVLISFGYYLAMNFGRALGRSGAIPPVVAGWGGNAFYFLLAWALFLRARR